MTTTAKAIRFEKTGGPEVLQFQEVQVGHPGAGQIRIRNHAIGLNYLDTYQRSGLYKIELPSGLGSEAAGVVEAVGPGVADLKVGDRVGYAAAPLGAYAELRLMPADRVVKLPDGIGFEQAAAMMLKGMTAEYLLRRTYKVQAGQTILVQAAAGGVGLILCQWAKALGVAVIGTAGSDEKAALARAHGCEHTVVYTRENFTARVREITGGKGVPVVYDSVGKDTWDGSLDCLRPFGLMASFGNASGAVPPFAPGLLAAKGSLYLTRQTLFTHIATREATQAMADELFEVVLSGQVKIRVEQRFPLAQAADAHRALEARSTTGSTVLLP